jgi:hypothetical protein
MLTFISAIDAAIVANPTAALVIDLTRMNYQWGDAIAYIFHKYGNHNPTFLLPTCHAEAWNGILTMTWPSWSDHLGKELRFVLQQEQPTRQPAG